MADSLPQVPVSLDWVELYSATGITPGSAVNIENVGSTTVELHIGETQPADRPVNVGANSLYPLTQKSVGNGNLGIWARTRPNSQPTRLQVDTQGGISTTEPERLMPYPSLFVSIDALIQAPDAASYVYVGNRSDTSILINQLMKLEIVPANVDGASNVRMVVYFNVDLTGSSTGASAGRAYLNNKAGQFADLTDSALELLSLTGFDPVLNPDYLEIAGGAIAYNATNQAVNTNLVSRNLTFAHPMTVAPGDEVVIGFENSAFPTGGVQSATRCTISGQYSNVVQTILPPSTADFSSEFTEDFA